MLMIREQGHHHIVVSNITCSDAQSPGVKDIERYRNRSFQLTALFLKHTPCEIFSLQDYVTIYQ